MQPNPFQNRHEAVSISRRAWLLGTAGALAAGAIGCSLPGGGPRTYFGGEPPAQDFAAPGTRFSKGDLREELAWLVGTLREVGARPFAYTNEGEFESRYASTRDALRDRMNAREFYLETAPLFASLNDGHAAVLLGHEYIRARNAGAHLLPFALQVNDHGVFVTVSTDPEIPRGSEILALEAETSHELARSLVRVTGGQTPLLRRAFAGNRASEYIYARYGERWAFHVIALRPDGSQIARRAAAATAKDIAEAANAMPATTSADYTFRRLADGRVGYIDYRSCTGPQRFRRFLEQTFASIQSHPVDGLVIDIRANGGGASSLNDDLWSYAQGKPFSQGGKLSMRVCSRLKHEYGFAHYNQIYQPPAWLTPNGTLLTLDFTRFATTTPGRNPLRYHGPVYLLIGTGTFSSAMSCALAAKDYTLATLVGRETGEPANSTGEVYGGFSPRVGIQFGFTTKYYWAPKPRPDGQGVVPDVTIVPTENDIRDGRDPVLDYAVRKIVGGAN